MFMRSAHAKMMSNPFAYIGIAAVSIGALFAAQHTIRGYLNNNSALAVTFIDSTDEIDASTQSLLYQIGVQPDILSAIGISTTAVTNILMDSDSWMNDNYSSLIAAQDDVSRTRIELAHMNRAHNRGNATYSDTEITRQRSEVVNAEEALALQVLSLCKVVDTHLTNEQSSQIELARTNISWDVAPEGQILKHTEEEWLVLRSCARINSGTWTDEDRGIIGNIHSDSKYIVAKSNHDVLNASTQAVWNLHWASH